MSVSTALLLIVLLAHQGVSNKDSQGANPIRKVVNMLQMMQKKVIEEGTTEEKMYNKFQCYCKNSGSDLSGSIAASGEKVPQVESELSEAENTKARLGEELTQHKADRDAAKNAIAGAVAMREKEVAVFSKEKAEYDANIDALTKAIGAIKSGVTGGFLQSQAATNLRRFTLAKQDIPDLDRQQLLSFLAGSHGTLYAPQSGEVLGILEQLNDNMKAELADMISKEDAAAKASVELVKAKTKQVAVLTASIEDKTTRAGKLAVDVVTMKNDIADTQQALADDQKFLAELQTGCATKQTEWEENQKTRAEELSAISATIKVLNDDDALELFKKTLGSGSSFLQMKSKKALLAARALKRIHAISTTAGSHPTIDFIALAMQGKDIGFEKVIKMIDEMVANLKTEQQHDSEKKEQCLSQFDSADEKKDGLERSISNLGDAIAVANDGLATLKKEILALEEGVKALDGKVAEATEQRKEEHADFVELMVSDNAAKKLLGFAKNTLNKFYNSALYRPPPTVAPSDIAGTGVTLFSQQSDKPPPPPETFGAYATKSKESTGVIAMIDLLVKDLDRELTVAKVEEENARANYENVISDASDKRDASMKSLTSKQSAKAALESEIVEHEGSKASTSKELAATVQYIQSLHAECDWLLQHFDIRKEARVTEVEQLNQAKAVLSGADYS